MNGLNGLAPSQDQIVGQIRLLIPILGTIATTAGWVSSAKMGPIVSNLLIALGPLSYLASSAWSLIANSRASIMAAAAKPVDANTPPPQIVLPVQEAALAQILPNNVNTTETKKVINK